MRFFYDELSLESFILLNDNIIENVKFGFDFDKKTKRFWLTFIRVIQI